MLLGRIRVDASGIDRANRQRLRLMLRELDRACSYCIWHRSAKDLDFWRRADEFRRRVRERIKSLGTSSRERASFLRHEEFRSVIEKPRGTA